MGTESDNQRDWSCFSHPTCLYHVREEWLPLITSISQTY